MAADPHCWYCGCEVYYYGDAGATRADFATIEHFNSRVRGRPRPLQGARVLACWDCNQGRNQISQLLRAEELRENA